MSSSQLSRTMDAERGDLLGSSPILVLQCAEVGFIFSLGCSSFLHFTSVTWFLRYITLQLYRLASISPYLQ